ncbi:MAG TPA: rhomboid family intramembrane serine protease, partial [Flavobacterium sp.]
MSIIDDLKLQFKIGGTTTKLIFWNVALFVIPSVISAVLLLFRIDTEYLMYVSLSSDPIGLLLKPWSLITYAFFHAGIWHLIFNLLMLNFAGRIFITFFTDRQLLGLYFVGGVFAGLVYIISYMFLPALADI